MYRYTIPFNNKKLIIITIGTSNNLPKHHEMTDASKWIEENRNGFPDNLNQLRSLINKEITVEIFNKSSNNKEYVLLIEAENPISNTDLHNYEQVSNHIMADEDDEVVLFVYGSMKMTRINKDLINFF